MDKLDQYIKEYCERRKGQLLKSRFEDCPSSEELYAYIAGDIDSEAEEKMVLHLRKCREDQALVEKARHLLEALPEAVHATVPEKSVKKARELMRKNRDISCPHCGNKITPFKKPLNSQRMTNFVWLVLAGAAFALSFVYRQYFIQCLLVSLFFGVKFIVDQKATKIQILIYKTLKEHDAVAEPPKNRMVDRAVE